MSAVPVPEKAKKQLPAVPHLTLVAPPTDKTAFVVVGTLMRGDAVVRRKVLSDTYISRNEALDEFQRLATRIFYFDEAAELLGGEEG